MGTTPYDSTAHDHEQRDPTACQPETADVVTSDRVGDAFEDALAEAIAAIAKETKGAGV